MSESLVLKGTLEGHGGWVTAIATSAENPDVILSSSRGMSSLMTSLVYAVADLASPSSFRRQEHHRLAAHPRRHLLRLPQEGPSSCSPLFFLVPVAGALGTYFGR